MELERQEDVVLGEEILAEIESACKGLPTGVTRKVVEVCKWVRATGFERWACERAGISWRFWKDLLTERRQLLDVVEHLKELAIEDVEVKLVKAAKGGRSWAVQMHLRAQRPHKYSEKQREEPPTVVIKVVTKAGDGDSDEGKEAEKSQ